MQQLLGSCHGQLICTRFVHPTAASQCTNGPRLRRCLDAATPLGMESARGSTAMAVGQSVSQRVSHLLCETLLLGLIILACQHLFILSSLDHWV